MNPYESEKLLSEYLLLHYGGAADILAGLPGPADACGFPVRVVRELLDKSMPGAGARALDVGCAVGASSFELSRDFAEVVGIDFSRSFIAAAEQLAREGFKETRILEEGERHKNFTARVPSGCNPERVRFLVGDATDLPRDLGTFSVVLAANLLCRLPEPRKFLTRLASLVAPGGQLLLATPFTWLEEFTPKRGWLGGTEETGPSFDALRLELEPHFRLDFQKELPMLIREHCRKFQYAVSCGTRWIREARASA